MSPDDIEVAVRRRALRLAVAVTIGLAVETLRGGALPMLPPIIALQLLAASEAPPSGKMVAVLLMTATGSVGLAFLVASVAISVPGLYAISVGLLYLWAFALVFTPGLRPIGTLTVTMTVVMTTMVAVSSGVAFGLLEELILSVIEGLLLVVLAHAIFPHPVGREASRPPAPSGEVSGLSVTTRAVLATVVMMPLQLYLTSDGVAAMVILLTTATMLNQTSIAESRRYAFMFAAGNGLGGLLAGISAFAMMLHGELVVLISISAATSIFLAMLVVQSERNAPVFLPGFVAYVVLFGLTLSSLPFGYDIDVIKRILQIFFAAAYALCAVSLIVPIADFLDRRFRIRPAS
jgi:hypothetical protein